MFRTIKEAQSQFQDFFDAVEAGDLPTVQAMTAQGFPLNYHYDVACPNNQTFLSKALEAGQKAVAEFLLHKRALPNAKAIDAALTNQDWDFAIQLIQSAHEVRLNLNKVFDFQMPMALSNKILRAVIETGADVNRVHINPNVPVLEYALHQDNAEAFQMLIESGANLAAEWTYRFLFVHVLEYGLLFNVDRSIYHLTRQLKADPHKQAQMMQDKILQTLDAIPQRSELAKLGQMQKQKIITAIDQLKAFIRESGEALSVPRLTKIQTRLYQILSNPAHQMPLLAINILDKNRVQVQKADLQQHPFAGGLLPEIAGLVGEKLNVLAQSESQTLRPLYRLLENLNLALANGRRCTYVGYDYNAEKIKLSPKNQTLHPMR